MVQWALWQSHALGAWNMTFCQVKTFGGAWGLFVAGKVFEKKAEWNKKGILKGGIDRMSLNELLRTRLEAWVNSTFRFLHLVWLTNVVWFKVSRFLCHISLHTNAFLGYFYVLHWSIIMEIEQKFRGRCIHSVCRHEKASPYLLLHHHLCFSLAHSTTSNLSFIRKCNFTLWLRIS